MLGEDAKQSAENPHRRPPSPPQVTFSSAASLWDVSLKDTLDWRTEAAAAAAAADGAFEEELEGERKEEGGEEGGEEDGVEGDEVEIELGASVKARLVEGGPVYAATVAALNGDETCDLLCEDDKLIQASLDRISIASHSQLFPHSITTPPFRCTTANMFLL